LAKYSREVVADVLAATDIVEIIGGALELKPSGAGRFKACCPFHAEKTPSFSVSRDRQMYYCFGCQKSGDAISFLVEHDGLSFVEALRKLADRAGIQLPALSEADNREDYERAQLLELSKFANRFFVQSLEDALKGGPARKYLKTRDLRPETVKRFSLGYAPDGWSNLVDAARKAGFKERMLLASGLAKRGQREGLYDFCRNRITFPIRDVSGNMVAFGARDLSGESPAKYINSPETAVYKKGRILYGLHEARDGLRQARTAILVEGYFDLLRCFDAGIENVVASCGTALTSDQAKLIQRYVPEVVIVFDGDAAGVKAALRGIGVLVGVGLGVRALILPDGKDPDDYIRDAEAGAFGTLVANAPDFITFYIRANAGRLNTIEGRTEVANDIFEVLAEMPGAIRRDEYLKQAAEGLRTDRWLLREEFRKFQHEAARRAPRSATTPAAVIPMVRPEDRDWIAILLHNGALLERTRKALQEVRLSESPLAEVLEALFDAEGLDVSRRLTSEPAKTLYAAAVNCVREELPADPETIVQQRIVDLKRSALLAEEARIVQAIRATDESKDPDRVRSLMARKGDIRRQIEAVGAA